MKRARKYLGLLIVCCLAWVVTWELGGIPLDRLSFLVGRPSPDQSLSDVSTEDEDSLPTVLLTDVLPPNSNELNLPSQSATADDLFDEDEFTKLPNDGRDPIEPENTVVPAAGTKSSPKRRLSPQQLEQATQLIENGQDKEAHKLLSAWYWNYPQDRFQFQKEIETLSKSIYLSPQPLYEDPYVIQSGDQLRKIARKHKLSWKYLARLNRVNPRKIRVGQKLKIVGGPFDAVIDLSDFELTVLCHGQYVRRYPVGIGKDGTSPLGKFAVKDKLEDPTYYGPDGVIANDDPENPLGERWIDIGDSFGIHGTIDPESIGKSKSRGCIRMLNENVEEVFDFLTVGSTVWIRR